MSVQKAYDQWSATYDEVVNKTRDLEKLACETVLSDIAFDNVIELGGGTGKNTLWLAAHAKHVLSVDLSKEMQAVARKKVKTANIDFQLADVCQKWNLTVSNADLITCSLILEHVEDLNFIFAQAKDYLRIGAHFYVCELHPFKQYSGSKARFEAEDGVRVLDCFVHNLTDYTDAAIENDFSIDQIHEWFDDNDRAQIPRLVSFLFRRRNLS